MAWHSSGSTNDELVDNLVENGLITDDQIAAAFRNVDRVHFVPMGCEGSAYDDRPLKADSNVHISAPHIYCAVLDSLELEPDSALSFLNIGAGTGYLSCIIACVLGKKSQCYGVEINQHVIQHCNRAINAWKETLHHSEVAQISNFHGNGLSIVLNQGESCLKYDRIYVGAAIEAEDLEKVEELLAEGGILVAPVHDCLTKVTRVHNEISSQTISGVHFAPLLTSPKKDVIIPATKWKPSNHQLFPNAFQSSIETLLLCSNAPYTQYTRPETSSNVNVNLSSILPNHIWLHILSFTHRKWFDPYPTEAQILNRSLQKERSKAQKLELENQRLQELHTMLQHEREVHINLIRRMSSEVRSVIDHQRFTDLIENMSSQSRSRSHSPLQSEYDNPLHRTQSLVREANMVLNNYRSTSHHDIDHIMDIDDQTHHEQTFSMEVDDHHDNDDDDDDDDDEGNMMSREDDTALDQSMSMGIEAQSGEDHAVSVRPYRVVSISNEDL